MIALILFVKYYFLGVADTKDRYQSQSKTKDNTDKSSISTKPSSPRRSLQNSRRKHQTLGNGARNISNYVRKVFHYLEQNGFTAAGNLVRPAKRYSLEPYLIILNALIFGGKNISRYR